MGLEERINADKTNRAEQQKEFDAAKFLIEQKRSQGVALHLANHQIRKRNLALLLEEGQAVQLLEQLARSLTDFGSGISLTLQPEFDDVLAYTKDCPGTFHGVISAEVRLVTPPSLELATYFTPESKDDETYLLQRKIGIVAARRYNRNFNICSMDYANFHDGGYILMPYYQIGYPNIGYFRSGYEIVEEGDQVTPGKDQQEDALQLPDHSPEKIAKGIEDAMFNLYKRGFSNHPSYGGYSTERTYFSWPRRRNEKSFIGDYFDSVYALRGRDGNLKVWQHPYERKLTAPTPMLIPETEGMYLARLARDNLTSYQRKSFEERQQIEARLMAANRNRVN